MSHDDLVTEILSQFKPNATQRKVFQLLSDKEWYCRSCEGKIIASEQYAGGGGIQGLQRGTKPPWIGYCFKKRILFSMSKNN